MVVRPVRLLLGPLLALLLLLAMPAFAVADDDDDDGGGGGGGTSGGGVTFSVQDVPGGPDRISGALEPPVAPPAGTPRCGALEPSDNVVGQIVVRGNGTGGGTAFGSGNVPTFGDFGPAPFRFFALSGPAGRPAGGVFDLGFPTSRESRGRVTCLNVIGNTAYIGGERLSGGSGGGGGDDDDDDD